MTQGEIARVTAWVGGRLSILGDTEKLSGHGSGQLPVDGPDLAKGLGQKTLQRSLPSLIVLQFYDSVFCDSVKP